MKENSNGTDTNVGTIGNSIEEDIKIINNFITYFNKNIQNGNKADLTVLGEEINALEHILSNYKRVLKDNEILKEEKEQAWEEWNNLEQGSYETEQKLKQQIKESQKENEELKEENEYNKILLDMNNNFTIDKKTGNYKWNVIEIQKVKDKIEEYKNMLKTCNKAKDIDRIKAINERILELQELIEEER